MPGIIDCLAAAEAGAMLADDCAILADHNAIGPRVRALAGPEDRRRPGSRPAGRRHARRARICCYRSVPGRSRLRRVEPVEWPGNLHQLRPLRLKSLPDRAAGQFGMLCALGIGEARSSSQAFSSSPGSALRAARGQAPLATRSRGVKKRSRTTPTGFSTPAFARAGSAPFPSSRPACRRLARPVNGHTSAESGG
jgi:hypothetical protein